MDWMAEASPRFRARLAGACQLLEALTFTFGQVIVLRRLVVSGNAAATAANILSNEHLFRFGFASCVVTTDVCNYPGETCGCRAEGAVNAWNCITCPAFEPVNGSSCTPASGNAAGGINCPYGNDFCACRTDNAWYCRCNGCP